VKRIITIGYEGASIADFIGTLTTLGVTTLLDIRELPISRRKGFAKTALSEHLARAGIAYRHERDLGSPRDIRNRLREDGSYERFFRDFGRDLATQRELLASLADELTGTVALLCYERDHRECHRKSVAAALEKLTGLTPKHHGVQPHGAVQARANARARPGQGVPAT
jgi:uncharacterized protein (DUF488 family)